MKAHPRFLAPLAVLLTLGLFAGPALAQKGAVKIGVVDTGKIVETSTLGRKVIADLKVLQDAEQKKLDAKAAELKALADKYTAGKATMTKAQVDAATKEYTDKETALRQLRADAEKLISKKRDEGLASIDQKLMPAINAYAKAQGYTMVFRKFESGLVYVDDAIDITNEILKTLK